MPKYRFIEDLTSDVMFEAYGKDKRELFQNAAEALLSVICQIDKVKPERALEVSVGGRDLRDLMFNWLQELISRVDTEEMFFSRFEISEMGEKILKARIWGEPLSPGKSGTLVKGVTYYGFSLEKAPKGWVARVACDI